MNTQVKALYNQIPSIDHCLQHPGIAPLLSCYGHTYIVEQLRGLQQQARDQIEANRTLPLWLNDWLPQLSERINNERQGLRSVFNLTGTVLHTNLGRALLSDNAIQAMVTAARAPVTLEYQIEQGRRGHRDDETAALLCRLTGAEAACIVNNNAAAVLLILAALAQNKEVILSRGELIEIGGSFRIPEIMQQAGCKLVEVGTTNRTHLHDYRNAITENSALLMKVHPSNYTIQGFTKTLSEEELLPLGKEFDIPVVTDLGSGAMIDLQHYNLPPEPMPHTLLQAGIDLVCFSGDKLLGGPQAGIIVGKKKWIEKLQQHPLKRALRVDKITLASLFSTLLLYQNPQTITKTLPTLRLLIRSQSEIQKQAEQLIAKIQPYYPAFQLTAEPCFSQIGSGSLPTENLPSYALVFQSQERSETALITLQQHLNSRKQPIIGYLRSHKLWLDLRCLEEDSAFIEAITT